MLSQRLVVVVGLIALAAACKTGLDCSLNGQCVQGACQCLPSWKGDSCDVLNLIPATDATAGGAYRSAYTSSWGASVALGPDGTYHMFTSEMANHCGLKSYTSNSQIVHATSPRPEGPFKRREVIVESFAHNPTVVTDPRDGTQVLYHIGCGTGQKTKMTGCTNGTTPKHMSEAAYLSTNYSCHGGYGDPANVYVAPSLDGPWHMHGLSVQTSKWMKHMDNPAPVILANGSVLLLLRRFPTHGSGQGSTVGVAHASAWNGTYVLPDTPIDFREQPSKHWVEDPFMYQHDDGSFHALFHNWVFSSAPVGVHAFSLDGIAWNMSAGIAYTTTVEGGQTFKRRERPHLILSARGHPEHLYTGVMPAASPQHDYSYTHHQAVHTASTLSAQGCMPVEQLQQRIGQWVGKVPYSHKTNKSLGYPTDCSGFVSWALNSTPEKAFEWGDDSFSSVVAADDLRFGDIFTHVYGCDMKTPESYISGHVFFFDKLENSTHFWAYESTETFNVTPECKARKAPCYNHHVLKRLGEYTPWAHERCQSKSHGVVHGGPRRVSPNILCAAPGMV
eukprot:TRINITY_DN16965_c0_g1_i3.p1 TRINITY_DN16965_c0_g1~~TRINITY_DN16965_c0_g1_i3.p1  ORF type:complete len:560 (+),score=93.21 TRINITY_DN16965_c0_g1_i3:139-1818(+)